MKNKFKVSDIARKLNIKKDVVRFWGKEFNLQPKTSDNTYTPEELKAFTSIKKLVHDRGISIDEAKTKLKENIPAVKTTENKIQKTQTEKFELDKRINALQEAKPSFTKTTVKTPKSATAQSAATAISSPKLAMKKAFTKETTQKAATLTKMEITEVVKSILAPPLAEEHKILVKEVEKIIEIDKPVPYIPQEFLDQVHLVKEKLISFRRMLD